MAARVIPLTPPGALWSQREYVACMQLGIGFSAHRHGEVKQAFHYAFPDDIGCTSVIVDAGGPQTYVDHEFGREGDWISRAAAATRKMLQRA